MTTPKTTRHKWIAVGALAGIATVGLVGCSSAADSNPSQTPSASTSATRAAATYGTQLTVTNNSDTPLKVELFDGDSGDHNSTAPVQKSAVLKKGQSIVGAGEARFNGSTCDVSADVEPVTGGEGLEIFSGALPSLNGPLYFGENEGVGCKGGTHSLMKPYWVGRSHTGHSYSGLTYEIKRLNETGNSVGNMHLTFTN